MSLLEIFLFILIIVGIIVGIYLIISLRKVNNTLDSVQSDLGNVNNQLEPILENLKVITDKAVNISDETEKRVMDISNVIQNVRGTVSKFSFRGSKGSSNKNPIQDLLSNLTAASKGINAFWNKLNN